MAASEFGSGSFAATPQVAALTRVSDRSLEIALQQLDRDPLRPADEAHAYTRPYRGRLLGKYDALGLELGRHGVDAAHGEPEMIEALIGRARRRIDTLVGRVRRDNDVGAAQLEDGTPLALLHAAEPLGPESAFEPSGRRLLIRAAQVDGNPGVLGHGAFPVARPRPALRRLGETQCGSP